MTDEQLLSVLVGSLIGTPIGLLLGRGAYLLWERRDQARGWKFIFDMHKRQAEEMYTRYMEQFKKSEADELKKPRWQEINERMEKAQQEMNKK